MHRFRGDGGGGGVAPLIGVGSDDTNTAGGGKEQIFEFRDWER